MSWIPRPLGENLCYHVRVQCNNKAFRFQGDDDFARYLELLDNTRNRLGFLLHHYTLMHTHVHLIITTPGPVLLNRIMQSINGDYARDYHKRYSRHGHFWINSYRCSLIDTDSYALTCMRYLDRNPIRAGITQLPEEWPWSGYSYYALGKSAFHLTAHPSYIGIASTDTARRALYCKFVRELFPTDEAREKKIIRTSMQQYRNKTKSS